MRASRAQAAAGALVVALVLHMFPACMAQPGGGSTNPACPATRGMDTRVTNNGSYYLVTTTSCNYYASNQTTGNTIRYQNRTVAIPMNPKISTTKIYVGIYGSGTTLVSSAIKGYIGMAMDGVFVYGNADAQNRDAYVYEGGSFDTCRGHADPSGTYHYHTDTAAGCVYNNTAGQHSPVWGVMVDGIPVYGPYGDSGVVPDDLDECGGHVDAAHPFYHYHLPNGLVLPYTVKCLRGCIYSNWGNPNFNSYVGSCTLNATQHNYSTLSYSFLSASPSASPPPGAATASPPPGAATASPPPPSPGGAAASRAVFAVQAAAALLAAALMVMLV